MATGKLKKASESRVAAEVRKALGVGPNEMVSVTTPQFERFAHEPPASAAPGSNVHAWNALRAMSDEQRHGMGMRPWGSPEPEDTAASGRVTKVGEWKPNLEGAPVLWLFPGEWYAHIPDGLEIVDINFAGEYFRRGETDNDIRFGCLAYGVLVRDAS